jgi:hypothetical protein
MLEKAVSFDDWRMQWSRENMEHISNMSQVLTASLPSFQNVDVSQFRADTDVIPERERVGRVSVRKRPEQDSG